MNSPDPDAEQGGEDTSRGSLDVLPVDGRNLDGVPDRELDSADGTGEVVVDCELSEDCPFNLPVCDQFSKTCVECKKNDDCGGNKPYCNPIENSCVQCIMKDHCTSESPYCLAGECSDKPCLPGTAACVGNSVHVCSPDGTDPNYEVTACGEEVCHQGQCLVCKPDETKCLENAVISCHSDGLGYDVVETCPESAECLGGVCMACYPGDKTCDGEVAKGCNGEGTGWDELEDCSQAGLACFMGACLNPCGSDLVPKTNAGCEFYAVDLDNAQEGEYDAQNAQYSVIVSNPSPGAAADVTVSLPNGQTLTESVAPMAQHRFDLPSSWSLQGTEQGKKAFKISSSLPIVAYQFNPLTETEDAFSNDASVLVPAAGLGQDYYVMTLKQYETVFRGYFTVVGVSPEPTEVTFEPTCNTLGGTGIPALSKGQTHTVTLEQGDVINIESDQSGCDLTGTHVTADAPVAVFAGHEAAVTLDQCCADHLEQQLLPVNTWGKLHLVTKSWTRWLEKDHVRILAAEDGTEVTLTPDIAEVPTLNAGEFYHFQTDVDVELTATKPVQVAQYLASSFEILGGGCPEPFVNDFFGCNGPSCTGDEQCPAGTMCQIYQGTGNCMPIGDPSMMLSVPMEQFRESYVFVAPDTYVQDYLNVIAPLDAQVVVLDDNQIAPSSFEPIGLSGYGVYRTALADGIHEIWSDNKIGIVVYGYGEFASYGYPGGMGLVDLTL